MLQLVTPGWRSAHERLEMDGWAGAVIEEMDFRDDGRVLGFAGCRIGEMNGLLLC